MSGDESASGVAPPISKNETFCTQKTSLGVQ